MEKQVGLEYGILSNVFCGHCRKGAQIMQSPAANSKGPQEEPKELIFAPGSSAPIPETTKQYAHTLIIGRKASGHGNKYDVGKISKAENICASQRGE